MNVDYTIPLDRFDRLDLIEARVSCVPEAAQGALRTALKYLYLDAGPINLPRSRLIAAEPFLEPRERTVVRWLQTRTSGTLRSTYGSGALLVARRSHYRCEECGYADVRALQLDHVTGRANTEFACLCANCHSIKSRAHDWLGEKRSDRPSPGGAR